MENIFKKMDTTTKLFDNNTSDGNRTNEDTGDVRILATSYLTYKIGEYSLNFQ